MIRLKRTYDPAARADGRRILVERLWPRGMTKTAVAADEWLKDVAPSTELRKWFGHRAERWEEFRRRYYRELNANPGAWQPIVETARRETITLLFSAHDTLHNAAVALRDYLLERQPAPGGQRVREPRPAASATAARSPSTKGRTHAGAPRRSR